VAEQVASGDLAEDLPPILKLIGITQAVWLQLTKDFDASSCTWIGQAVHGERACEVRMRRWMEV